MGKFISFKKHLLPTFFVLAFTLAWGFWIPAALASKGIIAFPVPYTLAGLLGAWGPTLAAIIITTLVGGGAGLKDLIKRLFVWRVRITWYLFVLLWPAALSITVTLILMALGNPAPDFANPPVIDEYPAPPEAYGAGFLPLLPLVFLIQFFGSSMGEEPGWRGFALPRMQSMQNVWIASLILGVIWGLWHLPRYWIPGSPFDVVSFGWFMMQIILNAVVYTWVYSNTMGSLFLVVLFHTAQPITYLFLSGISNPPLAIGITIVLVLLIGLKTERTLKVPIATPKGFPVQE